MSYFCWYPFFIFKIICVDLLGNQFVLNFTFKFLYIGLDIVIPLKVFSIFLRSIDLGLVYTDFLTLVLRTMLTKRHKKDCKRSEFVSDRSTTPTSTTYTFHIFEHVVNSGGWKSFETHLLQVLLIVLCVK